MELPVPSAVHEHSVSSRAMLPDGTSLATPSDHSNSSELPNAHQDRQDV